MERQRNTADGRDRIIPLVPGRRSLPDAPVLAEDPETAELDRLYQQALDVMEAADVGLENAWDSLEETAPPAHAGVQPEGCGPAQPRPATAADDINPQAARSTIDGPSPRLIPRQIVEAALFVGGAPLTSKKLAMLLRGEFGPEFIEHAIDELNSQYRAEERPYEIRLGEGGYRLALRSAFEGVRSRVFGIGPREIKLTQEALEVLALVAYQQPVSREQIEQVRQSPAGSVLRQLLRRELIAIERSDASADGVTYRTTDRFLDAFGLGRLEELPQSEELNFK